MRTMNYVVTLIVRGVYSEDATVYVPIRVTGYANVETLVKAYESDDRVEVDVRPDVRSYLRTHYPEIDLANLNSGNKEGSV